MVQRLKFYKTPDLKINGYSFLKKKKGVTSFSVISKIKNEFNINKVSFIGTLDPFANGLLVILFGKYTKLSQYINLLDKKYIAHISLRNQKTTFDIEGAINFIKSMKNISQFKLKDQLHKLTGPQIQKAPIFSAIKVQGYRIYQWAQKGVFDINIPIKYICLYKVKLIKFTINSLLVVVHCSKGVYIRTFGNKVGKRLNTASSCLSLKRIKIGGIPINNEINIRSFSLTDKNKIIKRGFKSFGVIKILQINKTALKFIKKGKNTFINNIGKRYDKNVIITYKNFPKAIIKQATTSYIKPISVI